MLSQLAWFSFFFFFLRLNNIPFLVYTGFADSSVGKEPACNAGEPGLAGKICWRRDRLPNSSLLRLPGASAGKKYTSNVDFSLSSHLLMNSLLRPSLCDAMDCNMPGSSVLHHLPELAQVMSIESGMPSNHLAPCVQSAGASALASALPMNIQD